MEITFTCITYIALLVVVTASGFSEKWKGHWGSQCACEKVVDLITEISNDKLTASSFLHASATTGNHFPYGARLHSHVAAGAWISETNTVGQWIQAEFDSPHSILGVQTQGRSRDSDPHAQQWVKTFTLSYSLDGQWWTTFAGTDGQTKVFQGNSDRDTVVTTSWYLEGQPQIKAKYIRLYPQTYNQFMALRFGVLGCD